jgi:glutamate racemase
MNNGLNHPLPTPAQSAPIGIFDSGVGGLTVLREIYRQLPNESVLYFGDTARLPYGARSPEEILYFVRQILTWMADRGVKMVMMACNTSSALALDQIQEEFPFPVLGLIRPGAQAAALQGKRIGVIATQATVASRAYTNAIQEINSTCQVWEVGCPQFVPIVEQNRLHDPSTRVAAATYLQTLMAAEIDTLVYGCTHYPHLKPVLQTLLPSTLRYIDPAVSMVAAGAQELDTLGLRSNMPAQATEFCVSGAAIEFANLAVQWLDHRPAVHQICLPELAVRP